MSSNHLIRVRPVRSYNGQDGFKAAGDPPYAVSRVRAAELHANGLVEYEDEAKETVESVATAEVASDAVKVARRPNNKMAPSANKKA